MKIDECFGKWRDVGDDLAHAPKKFGLEKKIEAQGTRIMRADCNIQMHAPVGAAEYWGDFGGIDRLEPGKQVHW